MGKIQKNTIKRILKPKTVSATYPEAVMFESQITLKLLTNSMSIFSQRGLKNP